ncbi:YdcH family protein [Leeia sp. TBRC 13508]|uniref:YdcH family protein n=1 Tax=Leeia speluncae TaxID=2884804 RepID=A0ABS8D1W7_9NEIS|nr:YdcH family protein [Leeia speluncae]MCB6182182.1 YdcH family protein [Leeia speluncae]
MHVEHHPLTSEFPELRDQIHVLKTSNAHFAKLFEEYESVDKSVCRAEDGLDALSEVALEDLKKERLQLKDKLYGLLKAVQ